MANRLVTMPLSGQITSFSYDLAGQSISRQNPLGNRITMAYDLAGRMAYDLAGRQISIQNELGYLTTTSYDAGGLSRS